MTHCTTLHPESIWLNLKAWGTLIMGELKRGGLHRLEPVFLISYSKIAARTYFDPACDWNRNRN